MKVAKEFRWEMGHRLPFHDGLCTNIHGHSYKLLVEFTGELNSNGIVIDYYDIKKIVEPIIGNLDHSVIVNIADTELIEILQKINSRHVIIDDETTAENISLYLLGKIKNSDLPENITKIKVKVFETETAYAEEEVTL